MRQSSQKTRIGDLELASIPPKYGPYLALPAGPEPAVWRLAPKTGRSGPNAGHTRVAHPGGRPLPSPRARHSQAIPGGGRGLAADLGVPINTSTCMSAVLYC